MRGAICLAGVIVLVGCSSAHAGPVKAVWKGVRHVGRSVKTAWCGPPGFNQYRDLTAEQRADIRMDSMQADIDFNTAVNMTQMNAH